MLTVSHARHHYFSKLGHKHYCIELNRVQAGPNKEFGSGFSGGFCVCVCMGGGGGGVN